MLLRLSVDTSSPLNGVEAILVAQYLLYFRPECNPSEQYTSPKPDDADNPADRILYNLGMNMRSALSIVLIVFAGGIPITPSSADTVELIGKPPFRKVDIYNFRDGRLNFRGVSKELLRKPLSEVARIEIDRCPILNEAEQLAATAPAEAIDTYLRAFDEVDQSWLRDFIRVRLLILRDRTGMFAEAVQDYALLLETMPKYLHDYEPRHPGRPGCETNRRAREFLLKTLSTKSQRAAAPVLRRLVLDLMLYDEFEPLPPGFSPTVSPTAPLASQPAEEPPLLFGPTESEKQPARRHFGDNLARYYPIVLGDDSLVFAGIRQALEADDEPRARRLLERVQPYLENNESDTWRLLNLRGRILAGQYGPTAAGLLALSEKTHDPAIAGEALYYFGWVHEKMSRADVARKIYGELLEREDLPAHIHLLARSGLNRIGE